MMDRLLGRAVYFAFNFCCAFGYCQYAVRVFVCACSTLYIESTGRILHKQNADYNDALGKKNTSAELTFAAHLLIYWGMDYNLEYDAVDICRRILLSARHVVGGEH